MEVKGLKKRYGRTVALNGVDLKVEEGRIAVIMGPSGCGKSTLIRCINRLVEADEGEILVGGQDVRRMNQADLLRLRRRVGFVFQHFNLVERLTVLENVILGLVLGGMKRSEAEERGAEALRRVGLARHLYRYPHQLSGGEQQRVGIARALAQQPELMLWDEPTASLDPIMVREVLDVMQELTATSHPTMLIVTHEVPFALRAADRLVLLEGGRVVEEGPPSLLMTRPRSELGRRYRDLWQAHLADISQQEIAEEKRTISACRRKVARSGS